MRYARVVNGELVSIHRQLPTNFENTSNLNRLSAAELAAKGWLPIEDVLPPLGPYESYGADPVVTIHADRVTREYAVVAPDLAAAKADRVSAMEQAYAAATTQGFQSAALGEAHTYPSTLEAQLDLVGTVVRGKPTPFACMNGLGQKAARTHTLPQIQQVLEDGAAHKLALYQNLQTKLAAIESATTVGDVLSVDW